MSQDIQIVSEGNKYPPYIKTPGFWIRTSGFSIPATHPLLPATRYLLRTFLAPGFRLQTSGFSQYTVLPYLYMQLGRINEQDFKQRIREILETHLDLKEYEVFVFGSRVQGNATGRSDIDIGLEGPERIPGYIMETIKEELEDLPYMQKVDIVDMNTVSPDKLRVMLQHTESLNL